MKKLIPITLILAILLQTSACSTSRALIDYQGFDPKMQIHTGSVHGTSLGAVRGNEGGEIWSDCTEKATESLQALIADAKAKGANAIGNLSWYATKDATPSCKKGWGYLVVRPFILTPLFMSTEVEGVAYKTTRAAQNTGLYMLPNTPAEEIALIHRILSAQN